MSRDAIAINISPDAKTFGPFPTLGADASAVMVLPDPKMVDAFGNRPDQFQTFFFTTSNTADSRQIGGGEKSAQAEGQWDIFTANLAETRRAADSLRRRSGDV
jgi:hypothetical protein